MGYRSNVVIVAKGELPEHEYLLSPDSHLVKDGWNLYHWQWIKWYASYPEINLIEKWLESLPEENYSFIRVGEDAGDIECLGEAVNFDCPFFASYTYDIDFGITSLPDWKNKIDQIVRQADQFKSVSDTDIWDYLCQQVDNYRNSLKNYL